MLAKHAEMDQDVAVELVADQEAEAARGVEPFDPALDDRSRRSRRRCAGRRAALRGRPIGSLPVRDSRLIAGIASALGCTTVHLSMTVSVSLNRLRSIRIIVALASCSGIDARTRVPATGSPWPRRSHGRRGSSPPAPSRALSRIRALARRTGRAARRWANCSAAVDRARRAARSRAPAPSSSSIPAACSDWPTRRCAIAARRQRPRFRQVRRRRRRHSPAAPAARRRASTSGSPPPVPAALAELAAEIGGQLGARGGEAPDIGQRQLVERACVERRARSAEALWCGIMRHVCATLATSHTQSPVATRGLSCRRLVPAADQSTQG